MGSSTLPDAALFIGFRGKPAASWHGWPLYDIKMAKINTLENLDNLHQATDFSKLLIATSTLNYLGNNLALLGESLMRVGKTPPINNYTINLAKECEVQLKITKDKVVAAMEELANFLDARDACDETDIFITSPAFDVVYNRKIIET